MYANATDTTVTASVANATYATSLFNQTEQPVTGNFSLTDSVVTHLRAQDLERTNRTLQQGLEKFFVPRKAKRFDHIVPFFPHRRSHFRKAAAPLPTTASVQTDGPAIKRLYEDEWSVRRSYSLVEALRALSAAEKPFQYLTLIVNDLYAICTGGSFTKEAKSTLRQAAMILDAITGLDSRVALFQEVGEAARIAADALEGKPLAQGDASSLNMAYQNVLTFKRKGQGSAAKTLQSAIDRAKAVGGVVNERFQGSLHNDKSAARGVSQTVRKLASAPSGLSGMHGTNFITFMYFNALRAGPMHDPLHQDSNEAKGHHEPPTEHEVGHEAGEGSAEVGQEIGRDDLDGAPPASDPQFARSPDGEHVDPDMSGPEDEITDSFVLTYTEFHGDLDVQAPAPRAIEAGKQKYVRIDGVPLVLRRLSNGETQWNTVDLSAYRVDAVAPEGTTFFKAEQRDYIQLEGQVYGVRELATDSWWIINRSNPDLPNIPLVNDDDVWRVKEPPLSERAEVDETIAEQDGLIRRAGDKFVRYAGKLLGVDRLVIGGESAIVSLKETPVVPLGAPNDMGVFVLDGGVQMIEGEHGYYRLLDNPETCQFFVSDVEGNRQVEVEYSLESSQWSVVDYSSSHDGRAGEDGAAASSSAALPAELRVERRFLKRGNSETFSHLGETLDHFPFFANREKLAEQVKRSMKMIGKLALLQTDLVDAHGHPVGWVVSIQSIRTEIAKATRNLHNWHRKSVIEKQRITARVVRNMYASKMESGFAAVAHCNEMADLVYAEIAFKRLLKDHILEIFFKESTGMTHVLVLYSDHVALLDRFGEVRRKDIVGDVRVPKLSKDEFSQWLFDNRKDVLLIDAWGSRKILDFSDVARFEEVRSQMNDLVKSADFTDVLQRFTVEAYVPIQKEHPSRAGSHDGTSGGNHF